MLTILHDIASRHHLHRRVGKWDGPCPQCGGSERSNKFVLKDDGGFKCYACDFKGDLITWLRRMDGMSCPEAHEAAGRRCQAYSCPVRSTCRCGDGSCQPTTSTKRPSIAPVKGATARPVAIRDAKQPVSTRWSQWAAGFAWQCSSQLGGHQPALDYLQGRGIDAAAARRFGLGWHQYSAQVTRASVDLPERPDGKPTLWLPAGLVIPISDASGQLTRLRIRRQAADQAKFLPAIKYLEVEGSGSAPLVIEPSGQLRGAVIVEAELDAMAVAANHPEVLVVAICTVRAALPDDLHQRLAAAPVLLIALDADEATTEKPAPGPSAVAGWQATYRQARYWPVPAGKDPGDYVAQHHGNLEAWVEAGLPPKASATAAPQDFAPAPVGPTPGDGGDADLLYIDLADGQTIAVTGDRQRYAELQAAGELVFSPGELERAAKLDAFDELLLVKDVFRGAYVGRLREVAA